MTIMMSSHEHPRMRTTPKLDDAIVAKPQVLARRSARSLWTTPGQNSNSRVAGGLNPRARLHFVRVARSGRQWVDALGASNG